MRLVLLPLLACFAASPVARAQRTLAHDTLSDTTPSAVSCGFCAGEAIGVVFRELPAPARGLEPSDFPLEIRELQLALAAARTTGAPGRYECVGDAAGGTAFVDVEIWAGRTPPTGSIASRPRFEAWAPDELLVWAASEVPVELSVPDADGSARYMLRLNRLPLAAEDGGRVLVPPPPGTDAGIADAGIADAGIADADIGEAGADAGGPAPAPTYLRVVVHLPAGGASALCEDSGMEPSAAVPVRDDDGLLAPERAFLYANGTGFVWSEAARVNGDWAIRLRVLPSTARPDAGPGHDASATLDAGAPSDAAQEIDARVALGADPPPRPPAGGCACRASACSFPRGQAAIVAFAILAFAARLPTRRLPRAVPLRPAASIVARAVLTLVRRCARRS